MHVLVGSESFGSKLLNNWDPPGTIRRFLGVEWLVPFVEKEGIVNGDGLLFSC